MQQRRLQTCWSIGGREQQLRDARLMSVPVIAHFEPVTMTSNQRRVCLEKHEHSSTMAAVQPPHTPQRRQCRPHRGLCLAAATRQRGVSLLTVVPEHHTIHWLQKPSKNPQTVQSESRNNVPGMWLQNSSRGPKGLQPPSSPPSSLTTTTCYYERQVLTLDS